MKTALVTGSRGFIATYLIAHLREQGYEVLSENAFSLTQADFIFHLGAEVSPVKSNKEMRLYFEHNVVSTFQLLLDIADLNPKARVVIAGSLSEMYPDSWYGFTKTLVCDLARAFVAIRGLNVVHVQMAGVTGVGKTGDVCNDFISRARTGVIQYGNLDVGRDINDVRDIVRGLRMAAEGEMPTVVQLGSGVPISVQGILDWVVHRSGAKAERSKEFVRANDSRVHVIDTAKRVPGYRPEISIEDTLEWIWTGGK